MLHRLRPAVAVSALALLVLPAGALAAPGGRGFEATYPRGARLCAMVAAGKPPTRLAGHVAEAQAACDALKSAFADADAAFAAATAGLTAQMQSIVASARAACQQAFANRDRAACRTAREAARAALRPLLHSWRTAARARRTAVDAARKAFWATITGLAGATSTDPPPPPDPIGIT